MPNGLTLKQRATEIKNAAQQAINDLENNTITLAEFNTKMAKINAADAEIAETNKGYQQALRFGAAAGSGYAESGSPTGGFSGRLPAGVRAKGSLVAPLRFGDEQLKGMFEALQTKSSFQLKTKAFNSVDSDLPAQLQPWVVGPQYEPRLLDRLPAEPIEAPSLEYIIHNATTGSPGIVAEGAAKPELVFETEAAIATVQKIAAHTGISWEIYNDWGRFTQYVQQELTRQVINAENNELLNGPGGAGNIAGILATSGILTHTVAEGITNTLDDVEESIAALRSGPALAEADLFCVHPLTWSAMRRTKDTMGRYLVSPDPTSDEAKNLWGVEVLPTTQLAAGTGILLDTNKFGFVVVREALTTRTGTSEDDFIRNIIRLISEERLQLAIERPSAVLAISGLPTS